MARQTTTVDILIASPGDVAAERDIVEQCILQWNAVHSRTTGIVLMPTRWERDATPDLKLAPQKRINKEIVRSSDLLIGVFWSRIGTATSRARSGTEEEILEFVDAKKRCLLYFSTRELPNDCDLDQVKSLREFKLELTKRGLISHYGSYDDLFKKITSHLTKAIQEEIIDRIDARSLPIRGLGGSLNVSRSRSQWRDAYELHKGSFLMYSFLQAEKNRSKTKTLTDKPDVCVSLLNIYDLSDSGIIFELFNPQQRTEASRYYSYRGVALPTEGRFLYFFGDQVEARYEVFCGVIEYVNVKPPLYTVGHAIAIGVNPERSEFRTGGTGFLLKYYSIRRESIKKHMGNTVGFFSKERIDQAILERMPRLYYKQ